MGFGYMILLGHDSFLIEIYKNQLNIFANEISPSTTYLVLRDIKNVH